MGLDAAALGLMERELDILKGVYINRYYQEISIANQKGVIACLTPLPLKSQPSSASLAPTADCSKAKTP